MSKSSALILVDLQRDFLADPRLDPSAEDIVAAVAGLLESFRTKGLPVGHIQTCVAADLSDAMPHWRERGAGYCLAGTPGADPPELLEPAKGEPVFTKRFYDGFEDPALLAWLREEGIDRLVIVGVHTHACVRTTAMAAYANGFEVVIPEEAVGSYDPAHAALAHEWLASRIARFVPLSALEEALDGFGMTISAPQRRWEQRDPTDWSRVLATLPLTPPAEVFDAVTRLAGQQDAWARISIGERRERLETWRVALEGARDTWVEALIREVAKPRRDAEGEVAYALALLAHVCRTLADEEAGEGVKVRYRPRGTVGIITPWNNPFAIPLSKLAPALGYGNCVAWKPALPGTGIAQMLMASLEQAGLGELVACVPGDAATGQALVEAPEIAALSFTGSVEVGQRIARRCGQLLRPVQLELGGNNAAIVLADADIPSAAAELAPAMFSFAGQRCTAIRRILVEGAAFDRFVEALAPAVDALTVGMPDNPETQVGPVISKPHQQWLLGLVEEAKARGASVLAGGAMPAGLPENGCWVAPTVLTNLPEDSPVLKQELFGPVVALQRAKDLGDLIEEHNRGKHGLLGAIFTQNEAAQARFLAEAQAGMLVVNHARPAFSAAGPFTGWKASSFGTPEHGRWNRDFYTSVQAVYRAGN